MDARDWLLSLVMDRCLRLELEPIRGIGNCDDVEGGGNSSSSSSSCCRYGFSRAPACAWVQAKSGAMASGLPADMRGAFSFLCSSKPRAHFFIASSFVNRIVKFSTPGSPFHQICTLCRPKRESAGEPRKQVVSTNLVSRWTRHQSRYS